VLHILSAAIHVKRANIEIVLMMSVLAHLVQKELLVARVVAHAQAFVLQARASKQMTPYLALLVLMGTTILWMHRLLKTLITLVCRNDA